MTRSAISLAPDELEGLRMRRSYWRLRRSIVVVVVPHAVLRRPPPVHSGTPEGADASAHAILPGHGGEGCRGEADGADFTVSAVCLVALTAVKRQVALLAVCRGGVVALRAVCRPYAPQPPLGLASAACAWQTVVVLHVAVFARSRAVGTPRSPTCSARSGRRAGPGVVRSSTARGMPGLQGWTAVGVTVAAAVRTVHRRGARRTTRNRGSCGGSDRNGRCRRLRDRPSSDAAVNTTADDAAGAPASTDRTSNRNWSSLPVACLWVHQSPESPAHSSYEMVPHLFGLAGR